MATPSWRDFYEALTANAQSVSSNHAAGVNPQNLYAMSYGSMGGKPVSPSMGKASTKPKADVNKNLSRILGMIPVAGSYIQHYMADPTETSPGGRVLDILSRGMYASSGAQKAYYGQEPGDDFHAPDLGKMGSEFIKGLTGKTKYSAQDVAGVRGMDNEGFVPGVRNFLMDVITDPTTYMGAGILRGAGDIAANGVGKAAAVGARDTSTAASKAFAKKVTARPTNDFAEAATDVGGALAVPAKSFDDFLKRVNVARNAENPGAGIFDNVIDEAGNPITAKPNFTPMASNISQPRIFVADAAGNAKERFLLPGPTPEVLTARASVGKAEEIAKSMQQWKYGIEDVKKIPDEIDTGWFREVTRKIPITSEDTASGYVPNPNSRAAMEQQALREKYAFLKEAGDPDLANIKNPVVKVIMSRVDEPVYAKYEPKVIEYTDEGNKVKKATVWQPHPEAFRDNDMLPMGELRAQLANPKTSAVRRARLQEMLINHIKAVDSYAKSGPAKEFKGASGYQRFYQEMYGISPQKLAKQGAHGDLPPSPFEAMPTYKEIKEWEKLPWQEKLTFQINMSGVLSPEELSYLSRASNKASYDTRLGKILDTVLPVKDLPDMLEGLRRGRINSLEEAGVPALLKHYNVKTLPQLTKAIEKDIARKAKAEKAYLGKFAADAEGNVNLDAPIFEQRQGGIKELGPTGEPYKAYPGKAKIQKQAAEAKRKAREVTPAEAIVQAAKEGEKSALAAPKAVLNESQQQVFLRAAEMAIQKNVFDLRNKEIWKFFTKTGVIRTDRAYNVGKGNVRDSWNAYSQYDFFKAMFDDIAKKDTAIKDAMNNAGVRGKDRLKVRADVIYDQFMPAMRGMDDVLKQGGVFPVIGTRNSDMPVSLFEILDSIDPRWVKDNIFTIHPKEGSFIAPTQLMNAVETALLSLKSGDMLGKTDDLAQLLYRELDEVKKTRSGKTVPNGFHKWAASNRNDMDWGDVEDFLEPLVQALPEISRIVEKNAAHKKLWIDNNIGKTSQAAMDEIARRLVSPKANIAENLKLSQDVEKEIIPKVNRSSSLDTDSQWVVGQTVRAALPDLGLPVGVMAEGKRAAQRAGAKTKVAKTDIDVAAMRESTEEAAKIIGPEEMKLADAATQFENSVYHRFVSQIFPHFGNEELRPIFLEHKSAMQTVARTYQGLLSKASRTHTKDNLMEAWHTLQRGDVGSTPEVKAAMADLNKAIGVMFGDPAYSMFGRNGLTAKEIDAHFDHFKVHPKFRMDSDKNMHDAWKSWEDVKDPLDLLGKVFAASTATLSKKLLGDQMMLEFGSKTKGPGMVKLANRGEEILKYVDTDNYYFPKEVAQQMRILNKFLEESMKPTSNSSALKMYDKMLHAYKTGLTIYRPGHHMRNMVGDTWLSYMAGVNNPMVYNDALKIMKSMGKGKYRDFDAVTALVRGAEIPVKPGTSNDIILYTKIGGKKVPLRAQEIYRGLYDRGVLNDYRTLDDLQIGGAEENEALFKNFKPFGGKLHDAASTISESRDHYVRLAHAVDVLKKGNFKSLDEAWNTTSQTVRKWHPDGSDLSHFESKVMRRTMLFYSWMRKAIPLVLEGMVMNPGKAMVYPKFMYDMAEAQGIDLDSLGNPFPVDQIFPSWITEDLQGPITGEKGSYMGVKPGVPMLDIAGDLAGNDPLRALGGMLTPAAKIPIEMMTAPDGAVAEDVRTEIPMFDKSDYLDKQIPNSNLFIGATGRSLTQPWEAKGGSEREIDTSNRERTILNFLSGLGITPMDKPGYVKQAKKERTQQQKAR